jgi:hypothetical protein
MTALTAQLPSARRWEPMRNARHHDTAEAQFCGLCPEPAGPMAWGYAVAVRGELRFGGGARPAHLGNDDCAACLCGMGAAAKALTALRPSGAACGWLGGLVLACESPALVRALWDWTAAEIPARHGKLAAAAVGAVLAAVEPDGAWFGACDYPGDWLSSARTQARRALAGLAKGAAA